MTRTSCMWHLDTIHLLVEVTTLIIISNYFVQLFNLKFNFLKLNINNDYNKWFFIKEMKYTNQEIPMRMNYMK